MDGYGSGRERWRYCGTCLTDRRRARSGERLRAEAGKVTRHAPTPAAERQRRYRARRRRRVRMLTVELRPECLERLVAEGWLNAEEARDAAKVNDTVADLLDCYGRRTLRL